jgi:hypothetical protein
MFISPHAIITVYDSVYPLTVLNSILPEAESLAGESSNGGYFEAILGKGYEGFGVLLTFGFFFLCRKTPGLFLGRLSSGSGVVCI